MSFTIVAEKDPESVEPYYLVWCSLNNTNDGTAGDTGELQGATISTSAWAVDPAGLTIDSNNTAGITIRGVTYVINTVATVWLSGGTANTKYNLTNTITTSDGRTLEKTITIPCKEQ